MRAKTNEDPQPPTRFVPDLDPHLEEIVLHAIERLPKNRYAERGARCSRIEDPSHVQLTGRAHRLHPPSLANGGRLQPSSMDRACFLVR